jgi:hypothetical protein
MRDRKTVTYLTLHRDGPAALISKAACARSAPGRETQVPARVCAANRILAFPALSVTAIAPSPAVPISDSFGKCCCSSSRRVCVGMPSKGFW